MSDITSLRRGAIMWWRGGLGAVSEMKQGILAKQAKSDSKESLIGFKDQGRR
jgi:hypothetical protein